MIFYRALEIAAATSAAFEPPPKDGLTNPFGLGHLPVQRWRVGTETWDELRAAALETNHLSVPASARGVTLLGWPVIVDEAVEPTMMRLERLSAATSAAYPEGPEYR